MRKILAIHLIAASVCMADMPGEVPRESAVEQLLAPHESPAALDAAIAIARRAGVGEQGILEARFLFHVDRNDDDAIAALAPEFMERRETFRIDESEIFATVEDWLAVTEYARALEALRNEDTAAFKKHITEAFWLSPGQGAAFAPHIERLHLEQAMRNVRVDFQTRLTMLHGGDEAPLASLNEDAPATLLHFWSPWSRECEVTMPEFALTAAELASHEIAVISILPESSDEVRADALELVRSLGDEHPGAWLVDHENDPLARALRIRNLPTMVLLDTDGSVLFNGHPAGRGFWDAVTAVAPGASRPAAPDPADE